MVVEFSKNCFELKKLCATVVGSSLTLLAAFTTQRLDAVFFVSSAVIIGFFWTADAQSYYYQEKLRIRMKDLQQDILRRDNTSFIFDGVGMPVSSERQRGSTWHRVFHSLFNSSMAFYFGLLIIDVLAVIAYALGEFHFKP